MRGERSFLLARILIYIYIRTNASTFSLKDQKNNGTAFAVGLPKSGPLAFVGGLDRGTLLSRPSGRRAKKYHTGKLLIESGLKKAPPEEKDPARKPINPAERSNALAGWARLGQMLSPPNPKNP